MIEEFAVQKAVTPTDTQQQTPLDAVVEEAGKVPRNPTLPKDEAQAKVLYTGYSTAQSEAEE
jgi:hypothetical protein